MENTQIPFSLERWKELVELRSTHHVETIADYPRQVRIVCTDRKGDRPIVGLITSPSTGEEGTGVFTVDGHGYNEHLLIVPNPPKSLGWVIAYEEKESGKIELGESVHKEAPRLVYLNDNWKSVGFIHLTDDMIQPFP